MSSKVTLGGKLLFPSEYLAAVEFGGRDVTLTIKNVSVQTLKMRGGVTEEKPVIEFERTPKKLVCNKTNAASIAEMYGAEADEWKGKAITLYPTRTQCGRETVDCIRIRETKPRVNTKQNDAENDNNPALQLTPLEKAIATVVDITGVDFEDAEEKLKNTCEVELSKSLDDCEQADLRHLIEIVVKPEFR